MVCMNIIEAVQSLGKVTTGLPSTPVQLASTRSTPLQPQSPTRSSPQQQPAAGTPILDIPSAYEEATDTPMLYSDALCFTVRHEPLPLHHTAPLIPDVMCHATFPPLPSTRSTPPPQPATRSNTMNYKIYTTTTNYKIYTSTYIFPQNKGGKISTVTGKK